MSSASHPTALSAPRWLADEMVGRLARYLRILGHDTLYVRGLDDEEIRALALREGRRLLTRDRALAAGTPDALLLTSVRLEDQLREVRASEPQAGYVPAFERCTVCNAPLQPWTRAPSEPWPPEVPAHLAVGPAPIFACSRCGHRYWEGSHTARVRAEVTRWLAEPP